MNGWEKNAVHYMKKNSVVRVKYIGEDNPLSLRYGKIYEARVLQKTGLGWLMKQMRNMSILLNCSKS